uniref:(California timema) hypothetical protein n=1 Tax=Timema californicum TaxID=61474 RepID=A0A7R9P6A7_TIMCA|nr:unnamed protein product [Timema californicum]
MCSDSIKSLVQLDVTSDPTGQRSSSIQRTDENWFRLSPCVSDPSADAQTPSRLDVHPDPSNERSSTDLRCDGDRSRPSLGAQTTLPTFRLRLESGPDLSTDGNQSRPSPCARTPLLMLRLRSPISIFFSGHFLPWPVDISGVLDVSSPASRLFTSEQGSLSKEQLPTSHLFLLEFASTPIGKSSQNQPPLQGVLQSPATQAQDQRPEILHH